MQVNQVLELVKRGYKADRMAQGYLVTGSPRAEGGELAIKIFQMLFCQAEDAPCGVCLACTKVAEHKNPDVVWVTPQKKSRVISADQMRNLINVMSQTSFLGGWKGCVIVGADRMNASAANIFLKTLEEPPEDTLLILLTERPQVLLPTIASRCQRISLTPSGSLQLAGEWREKFLRVIQQMKPGSPIYGMVRGQGLFELLKEMKVAAEKVVRAELAESGEEINKDTREARESARYREMRTQLLESLMLWYRDILVVKQGGDSKVLYFPECEQFFVEQAKKLDLKRAVLQVEAVDRLNLQMERNMSDQTLLNYWMGRLS